LIRLFRKLFNLREKVEVERPKSFNEAPPNIQHERKTLSRSRETATESDELVTAVDATALFYSLLFSVSSQNSGGVANKLEKRVMSDIELALASPQQIADSVLQIPGRMLELDSKLSDPEFDNQDIVALIQQDPVLSAEVIRICNSAAFRRSERQITSLQQALVQLGSNRLRRIVTTCMMKEMIDIKPIYFRRFGAHLWRHSLQVAFLAGELETEEPDTAFMVGLLHDVGKIAIFKLLLDAFIQAEPGEQPKSWLFRQVMTARSLSLSSLLVSCWQLPKAFETVLQPLANVGAKPENRLSQLIWQANLLSECSMLVEEDKLPPELLDALLKEANISRGMFEQWHQQLLEIK
jgi:HD-like signal output (HDOD) protein